MVSRLTPAARKPRSSAGPRVPGFASRVISTGAFSGRTSESAVRMAAASAGVSSEGVPPPKWMLSQTSPPAAEARISRSRASRRAGLRVRSVVE